jgi:hypothetical protein
MRKLNRSQRHFLSALFALIFFCPVYLLMGQGTCNVYEPILVGHPPENAFNGLIVLPDGEIRHYGFEGSWFDPSDHVYVFSDDNGSTWQKKYVYDPDLFTNENMPPPVQSPYSGDFIRLVSFNNATYSFRSSSGFDGPYIKVRVDTAPHDMIRQPVFLKSIPRILVPCGRSIIRDGTEVMQSCVFISDDDGKSWNISYIPIGPTFVPSWPHRKPRWQNYAIEPTITELSDGRLWMLLRTSMDRLYESFSRDNGSHWTNPVPSRFYATLTMPTFYRLKDGRLLLFFNSTTPLSEEDRSSDTTIREEQKNGLWEDVFTNRDIIHVAISEDDGWNWKGFRELYLNPLRDAEDFATRGGTEASLDRSVHQSQAIELPSGKLLVALGQHPLVRAMVMFDPDWLYENCRSDDFESGLGGWSTFKYIKGIKGHCAYNRVKGPELVQDPFDPGRKVLKIRHIPDPELVCDVDGAVWNFPAAQKGELTCHIMLQKNGKGGSICLNDRWFNPTDTLAHLSAVYEFEFNGRGETAFGQQLVPGKWSEIKFIWGDLSEEWCSVRINGKLYSSILPLVVPSINGINYVRFQSASREDDSNGFLIGPVSFVSRGK